MLCCSCALGQSASVGSVFSTVSCHRTGQRVDKKVNRHIVAV